ncbi:unnamed protein product [Rhizophagus irregularis]|nr:unnamed protein product [Rhizophagus irregularis]CAB4434055.1 unnamed protein product [Rhizophagus irregularis]
MFRVLWLLGWNGSRGRRYRSNQRSTHLYLNNIMFGQQDLRTRATEYKQQNIKNSKGPRWEVVNEGEGSFGSSVDQL